MHGLKGDTVGTLTWAGRKCGSATGAGSVHVTERSAGSRFETLVKGVLGAGVLAVIAVGIFSIYPGLPATGERPSAASPPPPVSLTKRVGPYRVSLQLSPGTPGANRALVHITRNGTPLRPTGIDLVAAMLNMNMGSQYVMLHRANNSTYRGKVLVAMAGTWQIAALVQLPNGNKVRAVFRPNL